MIIEPEILYAQRSWATAQELLHGVPVADGVSVRVDASWYDASVEENEGSFCLVQAGSNLEDALVGQILRVTYRDRDCFVYCVGARNLPTEFALARAAMIRMVPLWKDQISVRVEVVA